MREIHDIRVGTRSVKAVVVCEFQRQNGKRFVVYDDGVNLYMLEVHYEQSRVQLVAQRLQDQRGLGGLQRAPPQ